MLASPSGARGVSPPRSMVLASGLAEVGMGLACGVAPLREKPEMEQTPLLMGQGRSALKDHISIWRGSQALCPRSLAAPAGRRAVFSRLSGSPLQSGHTVCP